jgi:hypothetical protein
MKMVDAIGAGVALFVVTLFSYLALRYLGWL